MNQSFYDVKKILEENGVEITNFLSKVTYRELFAIDSQNILPTIDTKILDKESKDNIWCYFRDYPIPHPGKDKDNWSLYQLNIGTCAFIYLFSNEIDTWLRLPRQSGTTTTLKLCCEWYNNIPLNSKAIYFNRKINPKMKAKMKKDPENFKNDIAIVDEAECLSYADYNLIRNTFKHSYFASVIIKDADKRLVNDEGNFQLFTFDMYNNLPTDSKTPILITYPAEMIHDDHYFEFHKVVLSPEHYKSEILLQRN